MEQHFYQILDVNEVFQKHSNLTMEVLWIKK